MFYYFLTFIFVNKHRLPYRKERYINALGVMHNAVILPERATRCRYRPRAWVWLRLAWPGSAAQGKPRRRQARQAVALRRPGKTRKVSPGFEKYCSIFEVKYIIKVITDTMHQLELCFFFWSMHRKLHYIAWFCPFTVTRDKSPILTQFGRSQSVIP